MIKTIYFVTVIFVSQESKVLMLEKEFKVIEVNREKRGFDAEKLYHALLTIQSNSTSSERVFSVVSNFLIKVLIN